MTGKFKPTYVYKELGVPKHLMERFLHLAYSQRSYEYDLLHCLHGRLFDTYPTVRYINKDEAFKLILACINNMFTELAQYFMGPIHTKIKECIDRLDFTPVQIAKIKLLGFKL
jgi:hypothetical protein